MPAPLDGLIAWLMRKFSAVGNAFQNLTASKDAIPYCAVFPVSLGYSLPVDFSVSNYGGMLFCHVLRDVSNVKLVTYWVDEQHFKAHGSTLLASAPCLEGAASDLNPRPALWRRYSVRNPIVALAALIGAFSVIGSLYGNWFSSPDVVISYSDIGTIDCLENGSFVIPVNVSSRIQHTSAKVVFLKPTLQSESSNAAQALNVDTPAFEATSVPALGPGQSVQVKIQATAPVLDDKQFVPVSYNLSVAATADAGALRCSKTVTAGHREIRIWPTGLGPPVTRVESYAGNNCILDGELYLSRAHSRGLRAELTATGSPGEIKDMNVSWPAATEVTKPLDPTGTTKKVEFTTPSLDQFQVFHYHIYLELADPATKPRCTEWSSKVNTAFQ